MLTYARGVRGWALHAYLLCPPAQLQHGDQVTVFYAGTGPRQPYCRVVFTPRNQP